MIPASTTAALASPRGPALASVTALLIAASLAGACPAATVWLTGPAGAAVRFDGRDLGAFPLPGPLEVGPGRHELACSLPGHASHHEIVDVKDGAAELRWQVRLLPLHRRTAVLSGLLFAGLGQHYLERPRTGYLLNALELGGLLAAAAGEFSYQNHHDDYVLLREEYLAAVSPGEIARLRADVDEAYGQMEDAETLRNTGLIVAAGAVVVGVLDAWLRFPSVAAGPGAVPAAGGSAWTAADDLAARPAFGTDAVHVGWRLDF